MLSKGRTDLSLEPIAKIRNETSKQFRILVRNRRPILPHWPCLLHAWHVWRLESGYQHGDEVSLWWQVPHTNTAARQKELKKKKNKNIWSKFYFITLKNDYKFTMHKHLILPQEKLVRIAPFHFPHDLSPPFSITHSVGNSVNTSNIFTNPQVQCIWY